MTIERITVLGSGTMGSGIAQTAILSGFQTTVFDVSEEILAKARAQIVERLRKTVEKGRTTAEAAATAESRLRLSADFAAAIKGADYLIEAIPEKLDLKRATF